MRFTEFDLKTGQMLQALDLLTGGERPSEKQVEHSFLEHWLAIHQIPAPQLYAAKYYRGVGEADRVMLEAADRVLVYTSEDCGYFADPNTARLMIEGDAQQGIAPIYAADRHSPHNLVAYGSLISSDGIASTAISNTRILVIDDEARSHGDALLSDRFGSPIAPAQLSKLYDKMGDGTMLVSPQLMAQVITEAEREQIAKAVYDKAGIGLEIATIAEDANKLEAAQYSIERQTNRLLHSTVTQFRAATTDLPGMIKGTMATSHWCERLGVAAIISTNDIKGDDGRLSEPGLKQVSNFWLNRKSDAQYSEQAVGPQVKGCIPEATLHEFNPRTKQQAEALAAVASDPRQLLQHYIEHQEKRRCWLNETDSATASSDRQDWLYQIAKADRFGILHEFSMVNYKLDEYLQGERIDHAIHGIYVPSAMAQSHAQLEVWEVCNRDLPHGAIVAYYRSPFPNVGAAAIAINNTEIIKQQDPEAYHKDGVAYLPPWTVKNVAITDFDGDTNGYFCGYVATVPDLPEQIRLELQPLKHLSKAERYEAGRARLGEMIEQMIAGQEPRLKAGEYPLAVKEFIDRTAPEAKPPEVIKQKKVRHPWHEGESHSTALMRAWMITADNPTGKVANIGMTLQSLALETHYIDESQKPKLFSEIVSHYQKLLTRSEQGHLKIPTDAQLVDQGFPAYRFESRISAIAAADRSLAKIEDPTKRLAFVEQTLEAVQGVLDDIVNGPNAVNLQTAVDTAKSARGIDEDLYQFAKAIAHKPHLMRQHQGDSTLYKKGRMIPTNTQEPIGWGVEQSNRLYQDSKLAELPNSCFFSLFPKNYSPEQAQRAALLAEGYTQEVRKAFQGEAEKNNRVLAQPTMTVLTAKGNALTLQRLCDGECNDDAQIWQASGKQESWQIRLVPNNATSFNRETVKAVLDLKQPDGTTSSRLLGFVAPESVRQYNLMPLIQARGSIPIVAPTVELHPPRMVQNDAQTAVDKAVKARKAAIAAIPEDERFNYACALWQHSNGMHIALKDLLPEVLQQLQQPPKTKVRGLQYETNQAGQLPDGEYTFEFSQYHYTDVKGQNRLVRSLAAVVDEQLKQFGSIDDHAIHLPVGTQIKAKVQTEGTVAYVQTTDLIEPAKDKPMERQLQPQMIDLSLPKLELHSPQPLTIVTDGACSGNPGPGGWGAILLQGARAPVEIGGGVLETTNNRMEMTAGIEALHYARANGLLDRHTPVKIISDSQLFIKGATGEWKRKANSDLWATYQDAVAGLKIEFEWVKGHSGHPLNERVDQIAQAFSKGQPIELKKDKPNHSALWQSVEPEHPVEPEAPALTQPIQPRQAAFDSLLDNTNPVQIVGKPVQMVFPLKMHGAVNPLPVDSCIEAMRGYGRCHTTRTFEPYAAYGFQEGDIAIAYAKNRQVAFRVGLQYQLSPEMIADPNYQKQWAAMEKHSPQELQFFKNCPAVWGLKMEPLGDYINNKIVPFPAPDLELPLLHHPTRQDLRNWYAVASLQKDPDKLSRIGSLGQALKQAYNEEQQGDGSLTPPKSYQNSKISLTPIERREMQQDLEALKKVLSQLHQDELNR